jgi:aminopeptidase N
MDEGITCYAEARISNIYKQEIFPARDAYSSYSWMRMITTEEPVATAANHFMEDYAYYNAAYYKGQLFPEMIRYIIGDQRMKEGFSKYYELWKFKHPEPNDFVKVFEDVSDMELTWFQNYWLNTTHTIDLTIGEIVKRSGGIELTMERVGVPVPVELEILLKNGTKRNFYIPLDLTNNIKKDFNNPTELLPTWSSASNSLEVFIPIKYKEIESITIDPNQILPDVNEEGNIKTLE